MRPYLVRYCSQKNTTPVEWQEGWVRAARVAARDATKEGFRNEATAEVIRVKDGKVIARYINIGGKAICVNV